MFQILEVGTSIFEVFLVHILFQNWFGLKEASILKRAILFIAYFIFNCCYTLLDISPSVRAAMALFCAVVYVYWQYDTSKLSAIYGSLTYIVISVLTEYVTMMAMIQLSYDTEVLMSYGIGRAIYIVFAKLINLLGVILAAVVLGRNRTSLKAWQIVPLFPCQMISMYICHVIYNVSISTNDFSSGFLLVLLGLLYINAVVIVFIQAITAHAESLRQRELEEQNFQLQQQYYAQVQQYQSETHAIWHDMKKYILAMQAAAGVGSDKAQQEIQIIQQEFDKIGTVVDVDNTELNVILNHCVQKAFSAGVKVHMDVSVPPTLNVAAVDLSVIIGNTVDNAIEACQAQDRAEPLINIMIRKNNDMLFYVIENPYSETAPKKRGKNHGYGLKNVQKCVDKYHGRFASEQADGVYRISICLNL